MKGKRILFLAADNAVSLALKELVEDRGNSVIPCHKAIQALEYVRKNLADAIIVDPTNRHSGGAISIARMKQLSPGLTILVVAESLTETAREEAFAAGTDAIFTTPLSEDNVFATLVQALSPAPAVRAARGR